MFLNKNDFIDISDSSEDDTKKNPPPKQTQNTYNNNNNNNIHNNNNNNHDSEEEEDEPEPIQLTNNNNKQSNVESKFKGPSDYAQKQIPTNNANSASQVNEIINLDDEVEDIGDYGAKTKPQNVQSEFNNFYNQNQQPPLQVNNNSNNFYNQTYQPQQQQQPQQIGGQKMNRASIVQKQQQMKLTQNTNTLNQGATNKNNILNMGETDDYHTGIDLGKMQIIQGNNNGGQHEPGALKKTGMEEFMVLKPVDNKVKIQQNVMDFSASEDSDDQTEDVSDAAKQKQLGQKKGYEEQEEDSGEEEPTVQEAPRAKKGQNENTNTNTKNNNGGKKKEEVKDDEKEESGEEEEEGDEEDGSGGEEDQQSQPANQKLKLVTDITITDMKKFLTNPTPKGYLIQTTIKRDKTGWARFYSKYHMYTSNKYEYLMTGKKRSGNKTSNYLISMNRQELDRKSQYYLGKVRSNFLGTEFHVYDKGENPEDCKDPSRVRQELAVVIYESNLLGARGPRKMRVLVPDVKKNGDTTKWQPLHQNESMLNNFKNTNTKGMKFLYNKPPKWNEHVQAFVLNFNGRVDKPSVKNFQLVDEQDDEIIYLQFGRIGDDSFNLDFQWPITPLQAFGIALSSFDYKIACE